MRDGSGKLPSELAVTEEIRNILKWEEARVEGDVISDDVINSALIRYLQIQNFQWKAKSFILNQMKWKD